MIRTMPIEKVANGLWSAESSVRFFGQRVPARMAVGVEGARELLDHSTHEFWTRALTAAGAVNPACSRED